VRLILGLVAAWTIVVVAVVLTTPALMTGSPCAGVADPSPGCDALAAAASDFVWSTQTRPIALLGIGGYALIAIVAVVTRGRPGS